MNLSTQIHAQALRDMIQALRYEAGLSRRVVAHIRWAEKELAKLAAAGGDIKSQRALAKLVGEARAIVGDAYESAQGLYDEEIPRFASAQAQNMVDGLNGLVRVDIFRMSMTADQAQAIATDVLIDGAPSAEWWAAQEATTLQRFRNVIRGGMLEGRTGAEMAREVRDFMGTSMRNAQSLVRTSVTTVNNAAHWACYQANSDIIKGTVIYATLDMRTCAFCGGLDQTHYRLDEPHAHPSFHWACRCVEAPVTKTWEELAGLKGLDDIPPSTRASMNGQVAEDTTYDGWLKALPAEDRKKILGPARAKLLDQGKLTLRDLTDQRGNELTLAELRR